MSDKLPIDNEYIFSTTSDIANCNCAKFRSAAILLHVSIENIPIEHVHTHILKTLSNEQ